jgi:hypothetical protein
MGNSMKYDVALLLLFVLVPSASAVTIETGTVIKPNSTSSGHYILLLEAEMDSMTVTNESVIFAGVSSSNSILNIFYPNGTVNDNMTISENNITLPYTDEVLYLLFSDTALSIMPECTSGIAYRYGACGTNETKPSEKNQITINYNFAYLAAIVILGYLIYGWLKNRKVKGQKNQEYKRTVKYLNR